MKHFVLGLLVASTLGLVGCGAGTPADQPKTAKVTGHVKLDGKPLGNAVVTFSPTGTGRPSSGTTNAEGYYSLMYTMNVAGAIIGEHSVTVALVEDGESGTSYGGEGDENKGTGLPASAADGSILKKVEPGKSEIDIDLTN